MNIYLNIIHHNIDVHDVPGSVDVCNAIHRLQDIVHWNQQNTRQYRTYRKQSWSKSINLFQAHNKYPESQKLLFKVRT